VLANDTDANGDMLTLSSVTAPLHGTTTKVGNNVVYTANAAYVGADTFTYIVNDGHGATAVGTVNVTVVAPELLLPNGPATYRTTKSEWSIPGTSDKIGATVTARLGVGGPLIGTAIVAVGGAFTIAPPRGSPVVPVLGNTVSLTSSGGGASPGDPIAIRQ
jgi:hypothetical protein